MSATASSTGTREIAEAYFEAITAKDIDAAVALWKPGAKDRFIGQVELTAPDEIREYFEAAWNAFPDFQFTIEDITVDGPRAAVRWSLTATFAGPGDFQGLEPTGARAEVRGCDVITVEDGKIADNAAYFDTGDMGRQLGAMPPQGSKQERRMLSLVNRRTRVTRRIAAGAPEPVADGVWVIRGGFPSKTMNVYLVRDGDGVLAFDAGIASMTREIGAAGARMGGLTRVVLGHGHADHRGAAPGLGVPVYCHPADRADAESDGGEHYFDFTKLNPAARRIMPRMLAHWDGGPVEIAGTVDEGDEIAGFRVIHLPGHAPGLIGLWRESDRLALVSDCFYTLNPETGMKGHTRVPHSAFNQDTEQARASIRKLAALEPTAAWPGHADPVTGDVRAQLEQAAATT